MIGGGEMLDVWSTKVERHECISAVGRIRWL
jgi:hypothetical protein